MTHRLEDERMRGNVIRMSGVALVAFAVAAPGLVAQANPFEWSGRMTAGQTLEVRGITGEIRAELASGSSAEIVAEKQGEEGDFEQVLIRVEEVRDGIVICALYHERNFDRDGCDGNDQNDHDDDHDRNESIDVRVKYVVRVPAGVELVGKMVTGNIEAEGLRSVVRANTVTGDISIATSETGWGNTVSGDIDITMGSADWDDLHFNTVSGDITLHLPADIDADIEFNSLSGDFDSDFDLQAQDRDEGRWVGMELKGTIGNGGRSLSFNTVSGDVEIRRVR